MQMRFSVFPRAQSLPFGWRAALKTSPARLKQSVTNCLENVWLPVSETRIQTWHVTVMCALQLRNYSGSFTVFSALILHVFPCFLLSLPVLESFCERVREGQQARQQQSTQSSLLGKEDSLSLTNGWDCAKSPSSQSGQLKTLTCRGCLLSTGLVFSPLILQFTIAVTVASSCALMPFFAFSRELVLSTECRSLAFIAGTGIWLFSHIISQSVENRVSYREHQHQLLSVLLPALPWGMDYQELEIDTENALSINVSLSFICSWNVNKTKLDGLLSVLIIHLSVDLICHRYCFKHICKGSLPFFPVRDSLFPSFSCL